MTLKLFASELAAAVGMHRYVTPSEVLIKKWQRHDPQGYAAAVERVGMETPLDREDVQRVLQSVPVASTADEALQVHKTFQETVKALGLTPEQTAVVQEEVRKTVFTEYGTAAEKSALDLFNEHMGLDAQPDGVCYLADIAKDVTLVGRIDAKTPDGHVVEIKNRMRRLFGSPPLYERVQVQAYLKLLGSPKGYLVEVLRGKQLDFQVHEILRDDDFFEGEVVPKVVEFAGLYDEVLSSKVAQDRLLAGV